MKKLQLIREYTEENSIIKEYTRDGVTVSHTVKVPNQTEPQPIAPKPALEEQILAENQYQTALLEMQMLGGM